MLYTYLMALSLIIVAHNEEEHIGKTLASVYDFVDEIILVDAASTDETSKAAEAVDKEKKLRIYHEDNPPNFIINKQRALEKATKEWILELDADEIVTPELAAEMQDLVLKDSGTVAYWIPRLNHIMNKPLRKGGQYPDYTIRLYKKAHAKFPVKTIHDQVQIDGYNTIKANVLANEHIGMLINPLLHYPYKSLVTFFRKWSQYAVFDGDEWYKNGMRPSLGNFINICVWNPLYWFLLTYFRHRGYVDGFPGLAFSFFSGLRYWVSYMRLYELSTKK